LSTLAGFDDGSGTEQESGPDLQYYLALLVTVVRKYTLWALPVALVASAFAYDRATSVVPTYTATTIMHVAPKSAAMLSLNNYYFGVDSAFQSTQLGILGSRLLMRRIVEDLQLHRQDVAPRRTPTLLQRLLPRFAPPPAPAEPPPAELDPETEQRLIEAYATRLRGAINAVPDPRGEYSNLLSVSATWHDARLAAEIANSTTRNYATLLLEKEVEQALANQQYLSERLAALRTDLREAEEHLEQFLGRLNVDASDVDQERELATVTSSLLEARSLRRRLEGVLRQVAGADEDVIRVPAVANHPRIIAARNRLLDIDQRRRELGRRYGPRHARMVALENEAVAAEQALDMELGEVLASLDAELAMAQATETSLQEALSAASNREQSTTAEEFVLFDLQQDIEVKRELLVAFTEMYNQSDVNTPVENSNVWVVDPALRPGAANLPSVRRAVLTAIGMSLAGVLGLGAALELLRNTLTTPEELERHLSVPHLGTLPLLRASGADRLPLTEYRNQPDSYFSESIRSLRTALMLSHTKHGATRLVITSTDASEGKSSVAINLAFAFAQMRRTLIIDCDLRRPSLDRALAPDERHPLGLTDLLAGADEIEDYLLPTGESGPALLPAGTRTLNQLEVLSSPTFGALLKELDERFDVIILDSPPSMAVSDAYVLATQADTLLFVVKAGLTRIQASRSVLRRLRTLDVNIAGAVLNQTDMSAMRYASGYGGYYAYTQYGETPESTAEESPAPASS
jgi:capsular exopolysaccharide synthesis family protein